MSVPAVTDEAPPAEAPDPRLPPGPSLPRWLQTLAFLFASRHWLAANNRRYGGAVFMRTLAADGFVMVFDPVLVKAIFQARPGQLNAGEASRLGPVVGERSMLVLDGPAHLHHRRLMLPPFHGERMRIYEDTVRAATDAEIDRWPVGVEFGLHESMRSLTLSVIVGAVFGYAPGPEEQELRRRLRAMLDPFIAPSSRIGLLVRPRHALEARGRGLAAARAELDALLYPEIERRRADPGLADRADVFSALLHAEDERGERLTPLEVRDQLVTLLAAGHETSSTGLAWTFDRLLRAPAVLARARRREPAYLEAIVKEALRIRPIVPGVGRVVRGTPFRLGEWTIPEGMQVNVSIRRIHHRPELFPAPLRFRPERFLGADPPDTYTWVPFGGGTRRCVGASFAQMEMRVVLDRVLERTTLVPASRLGDRAVPRGVALAPVRGVRVIQRRPPAPASFAVAP